MLANDNILIYDSSCPMCTGYTKLFVRSGLLSKNGRISFSQIDPSILSQIDNERCRNEIPLINLSTNEVKYGINAIIYLLDQKYSWVGKFCKIKGIYWFLNTLYKFISYNRRVIIAPKQTKGFNCAPEFNFFYRLLFMTLFLLFNSIMLFPVHNVILKHSYFNSTSIAQFQQLHWALVAVNIAAATTLATGKWVEYLGQVNMLALLVILLMLPLIILNQFIIAEQLNNIYLLCLGIFMVREYVRRMKYACTWQNRPLILINVITILLFLIYL